MDKMLQIPGCTAEQNAAATIEALDVDIEKIGRELHFRQQRKRMAVERQMANAARARGTSRILRGPDGSGGQVDIHIHPESFHYWGQRLGYECWDDPQFLAEYKRDNPASRPNVVNDRLVVTVARALRSRGIKVRAGAGVSLANGIRGRRGRWAA